MDDEGRASDECVYWIQEGADGPIKIGRTRDVWKRRKELQTGNSRPLNVLATVTGDGQTERALHSTFAHLRLMGEWFRADSELVQYVATVREWDDVRRRLDDLSRLVEETQRQLDELVAEAEASDDDDEGDEGDVTEEVSWSWRGPRSRGYGVGTRPSGMASARAHRA
jgi:hypothetical protein